MRRDVALAGAAGVLLAAGWLWQRRQAPALAQRTAERLRAPAPIHVTASARDIHVA